jgi:YhcH/YjgK/YiaL family protein
MNTFNRYCLNDDLKAAFDFLQDTDLDAFPMGKTALNDRITVIKSTYNTYALGETAWESHKACIDIQYVLKGCEKIAYAPVDSLKTSLYHEPKDQALLKGKVETLIHLNSGEFCIFFPEDGHMPSLHPFGTPEEVTKIVLKVTL